MASLRPPNDSNQAYPRHRLPHQQNSPVRNQQMNPPPLCSQTFNPIRSSSLPPLQNQNQIQRPQTATDHRQQHHIAPLYTGQDHPRPLFYGQSRTVSHGAIENSSTTTSFRPSDLSSHQPPPSKSPLSLDLRNFSLPPLNGLNSPLLQNFSTTESQKLSPVDSVSVAALTASHPVTNAAEGKSMGSESATVPPSGANDSSLSSKHESILDIFSAYEQSGTDETREKSGNKNEVQHPLQPPHAQPRKFAQARINSHGSNRFPATIEEDLPNFDAVSSDIIVNSFFDPQLEAAQRRQKSGNSNTSSRSHTPQVDSALQSPSASSTPYPAMHRFQSLPNIRGVPKRAAQGYNSIPSVTEEPPRACSTVPSASVTLSHGSGVAHQPGYAPYPDSKSNSGATWAQHISSSPSPLHQSHQDDTASYTDSYPAHSTATSSIRSEGFPVRAASTATAPIRPGLNEKPLQTHNARNFSGPSSVGAERRESSLYDGLSNFHPFSQQRQSMGVLPPSELDRLRAAVKSNPQDYPTALCLVKSLAEAAKAHAQDQASFNDNYMAVQSDQLNAEGYELVKRLVSVPYPPAMFYLADCYGMGDTLGVDANPREAFSLYQSAAKHGHGPSAYRTAVCCEIGSDAGGGTRQDPLKAIQWYRRAALLGEVPAMFKLGVVLINGYLGQAPDEGEGLNWLKRAAERADKENPHALHELAKLYEEPQPGSSKIIPDEKYALELYQRASALGFMLSQRRLGQAYQRGELGLAIDNRMSIIWYTRAAAQGEHESELALSGWYLIGAEDLAQNDTEAYLWARKAAIADPPVVNALFAMGYYSERGIGCPRDLAEARRWYSKAAALGDEKAIHRLEEMTRTIEEGGRQHYQRQSPTSVHSKGAGREKLRRVGVNKGSGGSPVSAGNGAKKDCIVM